MQGSSGWVVAGAGLDDGVQLMQHDLDHDTRRATGEIGRFGVSGREVHCRKLGRSKQGVLGEHHRVVHDQANGNDN